MCEESLTTKVSQNNLIDLLLFSKKYSNIICN